MSVSAEAAYFAPPEGRPFNFKEALRASRRLLVKRVWPNLRDASGAVYKTTATVGVVLASPLFKFVEVADFDDSDLPIPDMTELNRELRRGLWKWVGRPTVGLSALAAALFAPAGFPTRAHIQDYDPDFTMVSQAEAMPPAPEAPLYVSLTAAERAANRVRMNRLYAERRAREHPVEVAPVYEPAQQDVGGVQVTSFTSFMSRDEHQDY